MGVEKTNERELYQMCSSPNVIQVTKLGKKIWVSYVSRKGDRRGA
jgi:hypothetical protein